jgi:hypothetical protein
MTLMLSRFGFPQIAFNAEGEGGGAGGGADPAASAAPENVLFPNEGKTGEADPAAGKTEGEGGAIDWKEYANDPAKSEAENAAAKVEHDKTKPAEKSDAEKERDTVPEDGVYKLTMPEGVELDAEMATALGADFKELGLTHAQAQKLTDKYIATMQARETGKLQQWGERIQGWADTAKKDPEIGGAKWDATVADAQRAIKALGTPELKDYLNASGGGNHPELIRVLAKAGALIKEDSPAGGGDGKGRPAEAAHVLFPNDVPKG